MDIAVNDRPKTVLPSAGLGRFIRLSQKFIEAFLGRLVIFHILTLW